MNAAAPIHPAPEPGTDRPLATFIVWACNQEAFIAEAVQGALSQTYTPLEIILSDDGSTDRTFEIMRELAARYQGPHQVVLNRNECNLGLAGHLNRIFSRARGEIFIMNGGDDISVPTRTAEIVAAYLASDKEARLVLSGATLIDHAGTTLGTVTWEDSPTPQPTVEAMLNGTWSCHGGQACYHRSVWDTFGAMRDEVIEDAVLGTRALLLGGVRYVAASLVRYRLHDRSQQFNDARTFDDHLAMRRRRARSGLAIVSQRRADLARVNQLTDAREALLRRECATHEYALATTSPRLAERMRGSLRALRRGVDGRMIARNCLGRTFMTVQRMMFHWTTRRHPPSRRDGYLRWLGDKFHPHA